MGKIYCIMGKSSTGKDTLFKKILGDESLSLKTGACRGEKWGRIFFL